MKAFNFLSFVSCFILSFSFVACSLQELDDPDSGTYCVEKQFSASHESDTKTSLSGASVLWTYGDKISVLDKYRLSCVTLTEISTDRKKCQFTASVTPGEQVYAVYPFSDNNTISNSTIYSRVPVDQSGSFKEASISAAKENAGSFKFYNATALFSFTVNPEKLPDVAYVKIEAINNTEYPGGDITIKFNPYIYVDNGSSKSNYVTVSLNGNSTHYASIIPGQYQRGFRFTLLNSSRQALRYVSFKNNVILNSGELYQFGELTDHLDTYTICSESFSKCKSSGGRDGDFSITGPAVSAPDALTDLKGWEMVNCHQCKDCILVGTVDDGSFVPGYALSPSLGIQSGSATVSFDIVGFRDDVTEVGYLSLEGKGGISACNFVFSHGGWTRITVYIEDADASTKIKFVNYQQYFSRFYLDEIEVKDGAPFFNYLNVFQTEFTIESDESPYYIPVRTNCADIMIGFEQPSFAYYDHYLSAINFTVPENTDHILTKSWKLRAISTKASVNEMIYVTQKRATKVILDPDSVDFTYEGGTKNSSISLHNFEDDVVNLSAASDTSSITAAIVGGNTLKIDVSENTGRKPYDKKVIVTAQDSKYQRADTVLVHVDARAYIEPVKNSVAFEYSGGSESIKFKLSNFDGGINYTTVFNPEVAGFSASVNPADSTVLVTATENTSVDQLSSTLTITAKDSKSNESSADISISQGGAPKVTLDKGSLSFEAVGGKSETVTATLYNLEGADLSYEALPSEAFSVTDKVGSTFTVTATQNTTGVERTGTVTVTATKGTIVRTATLNLTQGNLMDAPIEFDEDEVEAFYKGDGFVKPTLSGMQTRTVTYSISTNVFATIDSSTGNLTFSPDNMTSASATATVTATAAELAPYKSAQATYTVTYYRLPEAYREKTELVSDGTKHIDTGFTPDYQTMVIVDYKYNVTASGGYLFGSFSTDYAGGLSAGENQYVYNMGSSGIYFKYCANRNVITTSAGGFDDKRHTLEIKNGTIKIDENSPVVAPDKGKKFICPETLFIFYSNKPEDNTQTTVSGFKGTLYSFKIYDNESVTSLKRDYIPAVQQSGSVQGLWDFVEEKFYPLVSN